MAGPNALSQKQIRENIQESHIEVANWDHLHKVLTRMVSSEWIFRGVSAPDHYPVPSIGREAIYGPYKRAQEERLFKEFKDRAVALLRAPEFNDWHWLAYAQHLGVPTRLLDWTSSPLIGAFFALEGDAPTDRAIYCVRYSRFVHEVEENARGISPFECNVEGRFTPPLLFERIRAQRGLFTVHPDPTKMFYSKGMRVIVIPNNQVEKFRRALFKYGIDYWSVYPDAEGLGQQMRWQFRARIGLGSIFMKDGM